MSRQRKRACLEQGLSLDINFFARTRVIEFGNLTINRPIRWSNSTGYVATGAVTADLIGHSGWVQIELDAKAQRFEVVCENRHFGGRQRYFICPKTGRKASVLWRPPGAAEFRSRQGWGNNVAYITQIGSWVDRAHRGKEKIIKALVGGEEKSDTTVLPPKPRLMRLQTYDRYAVRFDRYDRALAQGPDGKSMMPRRNENGPAKR